MRLPGSLVISLDTELYWGSFDQMSPEDFVRHHPDVREVIRSTLGLFERFDISATWAVVGHLYLSSCTRGANGLAHPELPRPSYAWHQPDWFAHDPCSTQSAAPLWYGEDILDSIQSCRAAQEIGCHSFSHIVFGDPACTREVARADIEACVKLAKQRGIDLKSFVFPRNVEGHHDVLREFGFTSFRGDDPVWYRDLPNRNAKRAAHLFDQFAAIPPPAPHPTENHGLLNIPGSMLLLHRNGPRRLIPYASRVMKAKAGMLNAIRTGGVFHLWSHPFSLTYQRGGMLQALAEILRFAARLRDAGRLEIATMVQVADRTRVARAA